MRICTWNVDFLPTWFFYGNAVKLSKSLKERYQLCVQWILTHYSDCEVLLINEVFLYNREFQKAVKQQFPYSITLERQWYKVFNSGLVLLSKHPFLSSHTEYYKNYDGYDCFTSKGFIAVRVQLSDQKVYTIINTHMQQGDSARDNKARLGQCKQLVSFINTYTPQKEPLIFGGDLNMSYSDKKGRDEQMWYLKLNGNFDDPAGSTSDNIVRFLIRDVYNSSVSKDPKYKNWIISDTDPLILKV
jgi:exonuclease III